MRPKKSSTCASSDDRCGEKRPTSGACAWVGCRHACAAETLAWHSAPVGRLGGRGEPAFIDAPAGRAEGIEIIRVQFAALARLQE